jgi:hypothetical protein
MAQTPVAGDIATMSQAKQQPGACPSPLDNAFLY